MKKKNQKKISIEKKMILFYFFLLTSFVINNVSNNHYENICLKKSQNKCISHVNSFDCGPEYCARNKSTCKLFIETKFVSIIFKDTPLFKEKNYNFEKEINKIKICSNSYNILSSNDKCLNVDKKK